ncbi:heterokaryon incompatibility protein-domain-containing protein [Annulohypoxylon maeteangense]|uniref:heterokaryon incompatibility protein-domain-containing protein n=1 Tax=Annulohypoxylon maeteangense TaxID=1927788 RepID=UPI002008DCBA|nr:heterokaryon incompatibility protein-domain-containing protein [Annulohypoxylon maeteangense]KAI0882598.1 heterokaryon incompatibility protein-domain-containing protein [Annulohypoxylon maeteangense]
MPSLPQIEKSALRGCDFCVFLHNSILSRDTDNMLVHCIGKKLTELDTRSASISVAYCWSSESPDIYRDIHCKDLIEKGACSRQDISSTHDNLNEEYSPNEDEDNGNMLDEGNSSDEEHDLLETDSKMKEDGQLEGLIVRLDVQATDKYIPPIYLCCYATQTPGSDATGNWLGLALPSSQNYSEPHRVDWMRRALQKCETHSHKLTDDNFIPERLIDVQSPRPRLVLRRKYQTLHSISPVPAYAALSYCWGPPEDARSQLTTTNETFEMRQKGIEDHEMTQVLKDAIFTTRALGIRYLWVDALCIKQGDTDDWVRQSVDMSKIYGNAKVTLCAASSMSCQESFLRQRGSRIRMPFHSTLRPGITGSFDIQFKYVRRDTYTPRLFSHRGVSVFDLDLSFANWAGRGWVFQERFCSRSKLIFGNSFIHFLCDTETHKMGKSLIDGPWVVSLSTIINGNPNELYSAWRYRVLRRYARFNIHSFSNHTDLLPALSGLAQCFHQRLQDDFLAGFWKRDLLRSLLWFVRYSDGGYPPHETEFLPSHDSYIVPSWSILGRGYSQGNWEYDWRLESIRPATQLLHAITDLKSGNPFGAITGGKLTIRGRVLDFACLDKDAISVTHEGCVETYYPYQLLYNIEVVGRFTLDFRYTKLIQDRDCCGKTESEAILEHIGSLKWVLLGRGCWEHGLGDGAFGLILRQVPNSKGLFQRVGVFSPPWALSIPYGLSMFKILGKTQTVVVI